MIGGAITTQDGKPFANGQALSPSKYAPSQEVVDLFSRVQRDYQTAYMLQQRPFDEFDGVSLLQRSRMDQQTFGAFVGAEFLPQHKRWRWRGRKNTARNKIIGILAHMLAGMLFPFVYAQNDENEEDKMTARVMRILIEEYLRRAKYEAKFLNIVLSALVNPAVVVNVEYVVAFQKVKQRLLSGEIKILEAVDELLTGINLNVLPIDQLMLGDFYTNDIQRQPFVIRLRRITWDEAREIYGTNSNFKYVEAGKTRVFLAGQDNQTLYDIEWSEADKNYVQEITAFYRTEDIEVTFVGGVFMGNEADVYNSNPLKHRRLSLIGDEWISVPILPFAKAYFEPIDPTGRFAYGKSGAFKEFWDDATQNKMHQLLVDGTYLDVMKPTFFSGVAKVDSTVIAPGAAIGMPAGATVTPYNLGSNLAAALTAMNIQKEDMSESTQDKIMSGGLEQNVTAYATSKAEQNARIFLGVFGRMIADLVRDIGELTSDCIIQHTTVGELDATVPESLRLKYKTVLAKTKEQGQQLTNHIRFIDTLLGRDYSEKDAEKRAWELFEEAGGRDTDQRIYEVNPYKFARTRYSFYVDADQIVMRSSGADSQRKVMRLQMLKDEVVYPFVDGKALADSVIEEWSDGDPDKYKKKEEELNAMMNAVTGGGAQGGGVEGLPALQTPRTPMNV